MLQGAELLAQTKKLSSVSKSDMIRQCGYVTTKDGKETLHYTAFYEALLKAKGLSLKSERRMGRKLTYKATVQSDGKVIIGSRYLEAMKLKPGAAFEIKVGRQNVVLTPVTAD